MKRLLVIGASGHAKDVVSLAKELGYTEFILATSDGGDGFWGIDEVCIDDTLANRYADWNVFVAIGANVTRQEFMERFAAMRLVTLIAPTAVIGSATTVGQGCFIGHHTYIGPDSTIGSGTIINVGAVLGHDCQVGDYSQLGPRAVVLGNVCLGDHVFLGASSVVNHGTNETPVKLAAHVSAGMGVLVTSSVKKEGAKLLPKPNTIRLGA